jgi:hypothetical protein
MSASERHTKTVENLPVFGRAFDHMPLSGQLLQAKLLLSRLVGRFGVLGMLGVLWATLRRRSKLKARHGGTIRRDYPTVPSSGVNELFLLAALYQALATRSSREQAYEFILDLFRSMGPSVHATLYDIDHLLECDGDPFRNFCALNRSFFESSASKGFYDVDEIRDTADLQFVRLTRCLNVDLFAILGCPELARAACVADITGYGPDGLAPKVDLDFRRPKTLVHGDEACDFYYYRAGAAPPEMEVH